MSKEWKLEDVYSLDKDMIDALNNVRQPIVGVIAAIRRTKPEDQ